METEIGGKLVVWAGSGDDYVNVGDDPILNRFVFDGGPGSDELEVDDFVAFDPNDFPSRVRNWEILSCGNPAIC